MQSYLLPKSIYATVITDTSLSQQFCVLKIIIYAPNAFSHCKRLASAGISRSSLMYPRAIIPESKDTPKPGCGSEITQSNFQQFIYLQTYQSGEPAKVTLILLQMFFVSNQTCFLHPLRTWNFDAVRLVKLSVKLFF